MNRVGLFGGSFDPIHQGHLNSLNFVFEKAGLDVIKVIPAFKSPLKPAVEGPTPEQRLEMVKLALKGYEDRFIIDDQEIRRGGVSFTIETLKEIEKQYPESDLYLIIGLDKFFELNKWKNYKEILSMTHLIITSRPRFDFPINKDELPSWLKPDVSDFEFGFMTLQSGKSIQFLQLSDVDISATQLRKKVRVGQSLDRYLNLDVEKYIKHNNLYGSAQVKIKSYEDFTRYCANLLFDKKGINVRAFDLRELDALTEYALICSGTSTRHVTAISHHVIDFVKDEFGVLPYNIEGLGEGRWVVLDYGSLMVHLFYDYVRLAYRLEDLWTGGIDMKVQDPLLNQDSKKEFIAE